MLEFEIAAIYYFINAATNIASYFEEIPEDMITPCVFYPTPEWVGGNFSQSAYVTEFVLYILFMDGSTLSAYQMAAAVAQKIMDKRRKIPLVNENGKYTGKNFQVDSPDMKQVDNGVYQMKISWKRYTRYDLTAVEKAKAIFMNDSPLSH